MEKETRTYVHKVQRTGKWRAVIEIDKTKFPFDEKIQAAVRPQKTKIFNTQKEAKDFVISTLREMEKGINPLSKSPTYEEVFISFLNYAQNSPRQYARKTVSNYNSRFEKYMKPFYNLKHHEITLTFIDTWAKRMLDNGQSIWVINDCRKMSRAAYNNVKKYHPNVNISNPFEIWQPLEEPEVIKNRLTMKEAIIMFLVCLTKMPEYFALFTMALFTGMRQGEILGLKWEDINFRHCSLVVYRQFTDGIIKPRAKTRKSHRVVHLTPTICNILLWHRKRTKRISEFVFINENGDILNPRHFVEKKFQDLLELCGYSRDYMDFKDLRGNFTGVMTSLGMPLKYSSKEVGHNRLETTEKFYHRFTQDDHIQAAQLLEKHIFEPAKGHGTFSNLFKIVKNDPELEAVINSMEDINSDRKPFEIADLKNLINF